MNILLFILFAVFLGQPEHIVLILSCIAISGSLISHRLNRKEYGSFFIYDTYVHWIPALLSLSMTDFSKIGMRQFVLAALYPILYMSVQTYRDKDGWTRFKPVNMIDHANKMYPNTPVVTSVLLYYAILTGVFFMFRNYS